MSSKTVFLGGGKSIKLGDGDDEIFNCTINIGKIKENNCIENFKGNRFVRITVAKKI